MATNSTPHGTETRRNSKRRDFIPILDKCQFKTCNNFQILNITWWIPRVFTIQITSQKFPDDFWGLAILLLIRHVGVLSLGVNYHSRLLMRLMHWAMLSERSAKWSTWEKSFCFTSSIFWGQDNYFLMFLASLYMKESFPHLQVLLSANHLLLMLVLVRVSTLCRIKIIPKLSSLKYYIQYL